MRFQGFFVFLQKMAKTTIKHEEIIQHNRQLQPTLALYGGHGKTVLGNTFHSVVLARVYDIKNLKLKLRPNEEKKYNSPWNIAADFNVDMTFHAEEIAQMLGDYENDVHTGMDIKAVSREIYKFTSGYPYLVSAICKIIDERLDAGWTLDNVICGKGHLSADTPPNRPQ